MLLLVSKKSTWFASSENIINNHPSTMFPFPYQTVSRWYLHPGTQPVPSKKRMIVHTGAVLCANAVLISV